MYKSEEKLETIINELSEIIRSHKSNPEVLMGGVQGSERIIDKITNKTDRALDILSNIRDKI